MARGRETANHLSRRTDDAQHAAVGGNLGDVNLLDGAQRLCRGRVTAENHQMAAHLKKLYDSLTGELIDHLETARAIRRTGIVAQIEIIVFGLHLTDAMQDGQTAIAAVEDTNRA